MMGIKDEIKLEEYSQYYGHDFRCSNCGAINHKYIKKGIPIKNISFDCKNCGCIVKECSFWRG